jgi:hypothetical protein
MALGSFTGLTTFVSRPQYLTPVKLGVGSGMETYQSNDAVQLYLKNGRPAVSLTAFNMSGSIVISCTIIGKLK